MIVAHFLISIGCKPTKVRTMKAPDIYIYIYSIDCQKNKLDMLYYYHATIFSVQTNQLDPRSPNSDDR